MKEWMKTVARAVICLRVFAIGCVAGALGWPNGAVMGASAVLCVLLALVG